MNKLRCGFVGGGAIIRVHANVVRGRDDVEMVAISDVSELVLNSTADMYGIAGRYTDYREMVNQEDLDFIVVGVPNAFHAGATLAGLEAGCHVLCEKPPALNVAQAKEMAATAEKQQVRLAFGVDQRFSGAVETGRAYFEAGRLGDVYHASVQMFRHRGIPGLGSWFTTKAVSGGGALIDVGVHELDKAHYLMGQPKPTAVSSLTHAPFGSDPANYNYLRMWGTPVPGGPFDVDDLAAAFIRFENGASMVMQVSWAANTPQTSELRIMGTRGGLFINTDGLKVITEDNGFNAEISPMYNQQESKVAQMNHFIDCIRHPDKPLRTDARQGVVLQSMLDAIYESAQQGREVAVNLD